jgi:flagellar biogenesis protein FliO
MRKWINTVRHLLVALALAMASPSALAQSTSRSTQEGRAGDSDLGLLIILGVIAFFVVLAWLISRMGDDGGRGPDHNIL